MKKLQMIILAVLASSLLAGCAIEARPARLPGIYIDNGHHGGYHCPPGQHKKGRC